MDAELDLAHRLMAGEPGAFDEFVNLYHGKIFRYSYAMCGQREDAEEVSQEALFKVFESLSQLRDAQHLKAWVFRIARNACLMKRRKSVFAPEKELSLDELRPNKEGDGQKIEIADWSALPEDLRKLEYDTGKLERYKEWVKNLRKDIYLDEAVKVVNDMVDQQNLVYNKK